MTPKLGSLLGLAAIYLAWFGVHHSQVSEALGTEVRSRTLVLAAVGGLVARIVGQLIEAAFYGQVWRAWGVRIRFVPMLTAVACCSLVDALSQSLVSYVGTDPPRAWLAVLVGLQALPDVLASEPGLKVGIGSLGLLTATRVVATAYAQRDLGAPLRPALALTFGALIAGRLASWWSVDLLRGLSPLP